MKNLNSFLILFLLLLLFSCSTLQERKCESTDWSSYGRSLGLSGKRSDTDELLNQCQKLGIPSRIDSFQTEYQKGLTEYCSPDHVLKAATEGDDQDLINCPAEEKTKLASLQTQGHKAHCSKSGAEARANSDKLSAASLCSQKFQPQYKNFYNKAARIYLRKALVTKRSDWHINQLKISQLDAKVQTLNREIVEARQNREARSDNPSNDVVKILQLIPTETPEELEADLKEVEVQRESLSKAQELLTKEIAEKDLRLIDLEQD